MQARPKNTLDRAPEHALRRNEGVFRQALTMSPIPFLISNPNLADNPVVFANQAFLDMTGYTSEEIIGRNCRFLTGPETDAAAIASLRQAMIAQRDVCVELTNYRKDGSPFWNEVTLSPVFNEAQELTHFFASQKDITQRRLADESQAQAQRIDALGDLTGGIAHDFNNLLQVMSGYLDLIERSANQAADDDIKIRRSVAGARDAANRATMLTRQLLAFSRKQRLETRNVNLNDVIHATDQLRGKATDGPRLETRLEADLWHCDIDPANADMALTNILANACEALAHQSNPRISVATNNVVVHGHKGVPAWAGLLPGHYVSMAISDNGTGMDEAVRKRAMDPFFGTKSEGHGPGLGLSTVQGFVLQSGGTVQISSRKNVGTTVRLYFPAVGDRASVRPASTPDARLEEQASDGNEAILIVEDRPDIAQLTAEVLARYGYHTEVAHTGDEAWNRIEAGERYQLVFSDVMMPGELNGVDLAREIERRFPETSILLTSGFTNDSIECTDATGSRYALLSKPYQSKELLSMVRTSLDARRGGGPRKPAAQQPRKQKA